MQLTITVIIIIVTVLVSIGAFSNKKLESDLIFYPPAVTHHHQWYRFFTCGLIHADFGHLLFNMLSLFLFGQFVEEKFIEIFSEAGKWYYLGMYISAMFQQEGDHSRVSASRSNICAVTGRWFRSIRLI